MQMKIEKIQFRGADAVRMEAGGYEAVLIPSVGANLVRLYHKEKKIDILHSPAEGELDAFLKRPHVYGLPLLFPPNRIADGKYTYGERTYEFPITIPAQHNYHHGILKNEPFTVTKTFVGADYVEVETSYFSNMVNDAIYRNFPHQFECRMTFHLSEAGLEQTVTFVNDSDSDMPLGVGFHTPINVPFMEGDDEYKMFLSVGEEWELNERSLPTEKLLPLDEQLRLLRTTGMNPTDYPVERALTNRSLPLGGESFNGAIFQNQRTGDAVFYEVDEQYKHWTIWNNGGTAGYMCPEPQTWAINAPNLSLDPEVTGFQVVEPGDAWSATTKLYVK